MVARGASLVLANLYDDNDDNGDKAGKAADRSCDDCVSSPVSTALLCAVGSTHTAPHGNGAASAMRAVAVTLLFADSTSKSIRPPTTSSFSVFTDMRWQLTVASPDTVHPVVAKPEIDTQPLPSSAASMDSAPPHSPAVESLPSDVDVVAGCVVAVCGRAHHELGSGSAHWRSDGAQVAYQASALVANCSTRG